MLHNYLSVPAFMMPRRIRKRVFISYSHLDSDWLDKLESHLAPLRQEGLIELWIDRGKIEYGDRYNDEIAEAIDTSSAAILLVSPNFQKSSFIQAQELPKVLDYADSGQLKLYWIKVSECLLAGTLGERYHCANDSKEPLDAMSPSDVNKALTKITKHLERHVKGFTQTTDMVGEPSSTSPVSSIETAHKGQSLWPCAQGIMKQKLIRAQRLIVDQFTGRAISEDELIDQAVGQGWYHEKETSIETVVDLLNRNGVPIRKYPSPSTHQLSNELAQGHKVIVGVNSRGLWQHHAVICSIQKKLGFPGADHVVVVAGIDSTSSRNSHEIIVGDPRTNQAIGPYRFDQFVEAWRGSWFFMIATRKSAPRWLPEMAHFDFSLGHIVSVCGLLYEEFVSLDENPHAWDEALDNSNKHYLEFAGGLSLNPDLGDSNVEQSNPHEDTDETCRYSDDDEISHLNHAHTGEDDESDHDSREDLSDDDDTLG